MERRKLIRSNAPNTVINVCCPEKEIKSKSPRQELLRHSPSQLGKRVYLLKSSSSSALKRALCMYLVCSLELSPARGAGIRGPTRPLVTEQDPEAIGDTGLNLAYP